MKNLLMKASGVVLLAVVALTAWAAEPVATLRQPQGKVFVDQGSNMVLAQPGMPISVGDRVVTADDSRVMVVYKSGCTLPLGANNLLTVKDGSSQCANRAVGGKRKIEGFQRGAIGQSGPLPSDGANSSMADLKRPQGSVLVAQGTSEQAARHNMDVRSDDEIVTGKGGKVTVAFRGCEVDVGPQEQVTVDELRARCKDGVFLAGGGDADAEIAILKRLQGNVLVDKAPARQDMGVHSSNRIITGAAGKVTVVFRGCEAVVEEEQQVKVRDLVAKCQCGSWVEDGTDGAIADLKRPRGGVLVAEGTSKRPARHNMGVRRDDEIVTDKESRVTVAFRGCEVDVGPQEQVTVSQLRARGCKDGVFGASGGDRESEIAIIKQPQGNVMVDQTAAQQDMGVHRDNQIMTGAGSKVTVVFKACEAVVEEEQQVKVRDLATMCQCGFWAYADPGGGVIGGSAVGGGVIGGSAVGGGVIGGTVVIGAGFGVSVGGAVLKDNDFSPSE